MNKTRKTDLIHIRIEPDVKKRADDIFKELGVNFSYAISMFLNQVILKEGFPFDITLSKTKTKTNEEEIASLIEMTGGNGKVSLKNQKIIHLYAIGDIDYETAVFAIKRSFIKN
ncbi:MAG: type II toxin-antitoxin system RelB/DinJ family antitoxin [Acholeplasmataceae bacterium]|nr:type II toxin-antitoxin system RelB/DinJ family antitoxin [Acholeplasmataceae bacterium]